MQVSVLVCFKSVAGAKLPHPSAQVTMVEKKPALFSPKYALAYKGSDIYIIRNRWLAIGVALGSAGFPHCVLPAFSNIDLRHSRPERNFCASHVQPPRRFVASKRSRAMFLLALWDGIIRIACFECICFQMPIENISRVLPWVS